MRDWTKGLAVASLLACTACTRSGASEGLRMSGWVSSPAEDELMRELVEAFEASEPGVKVTYDPIQANYMEKIQLMLGTGTAPDVFMLDAFWAPSLIQYGTLLPLSAEGSGSSDFNPWLLDAFRKGDELYGLPKDFSPLVLFYNPTMLEEAGVERPPRTWSELREAARKLTRDLDGDGRVDVYGFGLVDGLEYVLPFVWQNEAELFDDEGELDVRSDGFVGALGFLQSLRREGWARLPSEVGAAWNMDGFGRGKVAMSISGLWALSFLATTFPETKYGVAPLPFSKQARTIAYVVGYAIPRDTKKPEEARKLLEFMTSEEVQLRWAREGAGLPPRSSVVRQLNLGADPVRSVFVASSSIARTWQLGPHARAVDDLQSALQAVFVADEEVSAAMTHLERRVERRRSRRRGE